MDLMNAFAMFLGYAFMIGVALFALAVIIIGGWEYTKHPSGFYTIYKWWGFGIIIAHKEHMIEKIQDVRKAPDSGFQIEGGRLFIDAPKWFNKYVYNFGKVE